MFRASKQHGTGTYHSNTRHGMNLLNAKDTILLIVSDLAENRAWHKQNYEGNFATSNHSP